MDEKSIGEEERKRRRGRAHAHAGKILGVVNWRDELIRIIDLKREWTCSKMYLLHLRDKFVRRDGENIAQTAMASEDIESCIANNHSIKIQQI